MITLADYRRLYRTGPDVTADTMTLADALLQETFNKRTMLTNYAERPIHEIRAAILASRKFKLDEAMSAFLADLSMVAFKTADPESVFHSIRHSALLPHPVTWIEFSGRAFRRRCIELGGRTVTGEGVSRPEEAAAIWGMLMEQHPKISTAIRMTEYLGDELGPIAMPFSHCWNAADEPLPWNVDFENGMLGAGIIGMVTPYVGTIMPKRHEKTTRQFETDSGRKFNTNQLIIETIGVLRYTLAFLASLNDMPCVTREVMPTKKWYARGQYKKFLDHTVIHLNLPASKNQQNVARRLISNVHRRAHEVRGHWRLYERKADFACQHLWSAIDDTSHSRCSACPSWRTWIAEHQRGDASIGFVTHNYAVGHKSI